MQIIGLNTPQNHRPFKGALFNAASYVEASTLLNKGIVDIGGFVIPQAVMSNNKDESVERVFKSLLYFVFTFVSPFVLLPMINKIALRSAKLVKNFNTDEKRILEMSKKYLSTTAEDMLKGIKETSKRLFNDENKFNSLTKRFEDPEELRQRLIKTHTKVLTTDFLTTNLMVGAIPWLGNMLTKYRTNRSGYSGTYEMADESFTKKASEKHEKSKKKRQAATFLLAVLPALTVPPLLKKGMMNKNLGKITGWFNKNSHKFDYLNAKSMSRLTALIMWITSDYFPYQLACRDKYEYRDTVIRGTSIGLVFWGGDLLLKKILAKTSDKLFGTKLMNTETKTAFRISDLKDVNINKFKSLKNIDMKTLQKTRNAAIGLYILNLATVSATLGFGLPAMLNRLLRRTVNKDMQTRFTTSKPAAFEAFNLDTTKRTSKLINVQ